MLFVSDDGRAIPMQDRIGVHGELVVSQVRTFENPTRKSVQ